MFKAIVTELKKFVTVLSTHPKVRLLNRAAIYGDEEAMYALGKIFEKGDLVERDCVQAYAMYTFAHMKKYKPALSELKRVEALLSSEQLEQANKIIKNKIQSGFYKGIG